MSMFCTSVRSRRWSSRRRKAAASSSVRVLSSMFSGVLAHLVLLRFGLPGARPRGSGDGESYGCPGRREQGRARRATTPAQRAAPSSVAIRSCRTSMMHVREPARACHAPTACRPRGRRHRARCRRPARSAPPRKPCDQRPCAMRGSASHRSPISQGRGTPLQAGVNEWIDRMAGGLPVGDHLRRSARLRSPGRAARSGRCAGRPRRRRRWRCRARWRRRRAASPASGRPRRDWGRSAGARSASARPARRTAPPAAASPPPRRCRRRCGAANCAGRQAERAVFRRQRVGGVVAQHDEPAVERARDRLHGSEGRSNVGIWTCAVVTGANYPKRSGDVMLPPALGARRERAAIGRANAACVDTGPARSDQSAPRPPRR